MLGGLLGTGSDGTTCLLWMFLSWLSFCRLPFGHREDAVGLHLVDQP